MNKAARSRGVELAKPLEIRVAGIPIDADQRDRFRSLLTAKVRQQLDEVQLIEQIVLEPQHQLVVAVVVVDGLAPSAQIGSDVGGAILRGKEASPDHQQFVVRHVARHRAFVQRIGPDPGATRHTRPFDQSCRAVTVGNVKNAHALETSCGGGP